MPGIFEGGYLGIGIVAFGGPEQQVLALFAIELQVKVNQVNTFVLDVFPQNIKVVAKV